MLFWATLSFCLLFTGVIGHDCLNLEANDLSDFDVTKISGSYNLVMMEMETPFDKYPQFLNCNTVLMRTHNHPASGINLGIHIYRAKPSTCMLMNLLPHFNSSKDTYAIEIDYFSVDNASWRDNHFKVLHLSEDLFAATACSNDEDDPTNDRFYTMVFRRQESKLTVEDIKNILPSSVVSRLQIVC